MKQPRSIAKKKLKNETLLTYRWWISIDTLISFLFISFPTYFVYILAHALQEHKIIFVLLFCVFLLLCRNLVFNLLNRTYVLLSPEKISSWDWPFGRKQAISIKPSHISGVSVEENKELFSRASPYLYTIYITLNSSEEVPLVIDLPSHQAAFFIERELKQFLNITPEEISPLEIKVEERMRTGIRDSFVILFIFCLILWLLDVIKACK